MALLSLGLGLRAIGWYKVKAPRVDANIVDHHLGHSYLEVLLSMAKGRLTAARKTRAATNRKLSSAVWAFHFLVSAVAFGALAAGSYVAGGISPSSGG